MTEQIDSIDDARRLARAARRSRGLTQAEVAGLGGRSQKWISDFERGNGGDPPFSMVLGLLRLLGVRLGAALPEPQETHGDANHDDGREFDVDEGL